jgi:Tfp pilus assembly protein PilX
MKPSERRLQSGQVGLVTLLIMAVILTIAIGLSQRTIQQQDTAFIQDESTRVFNAAESGIEEALSDITAAEQAGTVDSEFRADGTFPLEDSSVAYSAYTSSIFEMNVSQGKTVEIPVAGDGTTNVTVQWWYQKPTNCASNQPAAIIASVLNSTTATHYAYDPCADERLSNFSDTISAGSDDYSYQVSIPIALGDLLLRLKPVFNNTQFRIDGTPISLAQYDASADALNQTENIARSIEVKRSLPGSFSFMDYTLVSGSSLTKN